MELIKKLQNVLFLILIAFASGKAWAQTEISSLSEITNLNGNYKLTADISGAGHTSIANFTGTLDGDYHVIEGLDSPLFSTVDGATIKNVTLKDVSISGTGNVGAIACTASGATKVYNCGVIGLSSTVSGTAAVGSIVGRLNDASRVVNCYSYANVSGGQYTAGIVGRNAVATTAATFSDYADNGSLSLDSWTKSTTNATSGNWEVNTWSTENDASGLKTPFYQSWRARGNAISGNISYTHTNWNNMPNGEYTISMTIRLMNEADQLGNNNNRYPNATATLTLNGTAYPITWTNSNANNYRVAYVHFNQLVNITNGTLTATLSFSNFQNTSWIAFGGMIAEPNNGAVAVANCMYYGKITAGSNISPVYAGNHESNNRGYNEYNFWRSLAYEEGDKKYDNYNDQLAVGKDEYLNRFPFYRHILNTHRKLASFYLFGDYSHVEEIGHWFNTKNVKGEVNETPYPIIEKWQTGTKRTTVDIKNNLPNSTEERVGKLLTGQDASGNTVGTNGYLKVNVVIPGHSYTADLPITDMDEANWDFTWGKVVLPFANEFDGWSYDETGLGSWGKIITGWKVSNLVGGTAGTQAEQGSVFNYFDRDKYYNDRDYVFAQGGNYIVPYGVTEITLTANLATAVYLSDPAYDLSYDTNYGNKTPRGGTVPATYYGKTVYTDLSTAIQSLTEQTNPNNQAVVLVGNYHYNQQTEGTEFDTAKGLTIMSVDEDKNQEPDYGWYSFHTTDRTDVPALRFDFVPNIGIGMAARVENSVRNPTIGIWHAHGWFELTETCVSYMSECEINDYSFANKARWIANSGFFIQIVRGWDGACNKLDYLQIGGNAYVQQLYPGPHMAKAHQTALCPIVVTGGEIEECFMSGKGSGTPKITGTDIQFWCSGGKIHKYLSAYMVNPSNNNVNVTAKVDHALVSRFFGGGTSPTATIKGNINVTINNSYVDFYCGGPEFGDMNDGKTVTTTASGSTFGEFYGGGYGGTSTTWIQRTDVTPTFNGDREFGGDFNANYVNHRLQNDEGGIGVGASYDFEYIQYSGGNGLGVERFYTGYINFSLASTGSVTNNLSKCTILGNFYGGGCQGQVKGNTTSTLTDCTVKGSAFAAGYKPAESVAPVYPTTQPTYSTYYFKEGYFSDFIFPEPENFVWKQADDTHGNLTVDEANKIIYTSVDMSQGGVVTGNAVITLKGNSQVDGLIGNEQTGGVFGGGNESKLNGTSTVNIESTGGLINAVYGGANKADVGGDTQVNIKSGNVGTVYGANNISGEKSGTVTVEMTGGTVTNDIYGGGNLAAYTSPVAEKNYPVVTILNGTVNGSVYGGGYGVSAEKKEGDELEYARNAAVIDGNPQVTIGDWNPDHKVRIEKNVFGGGAMAAVEGNPVVVVNDCDTKIGGDVYGGGDAAPVYSTDVTVWGGIIKGNIFGGGNGADANNENTRNSNGAQIGYQRDDTTEEGSGDVILRVYGGTLGTWTDGNCLPGTGGIFGGSNTKGSITGKIDVNIDNKAHSEDVDPCDFKARELYGAGNKAEFYGNGLICTIGCVSGVDEIFGGAKATDIGSATSPINIQLNITNGTFNKVFGGNNLSGNIYGTIEVNIHEVGCKPIVIKEGLYGGGYLAAYNGSPVVNVYSCSYINNIFGGGLGREAVVTGNPIVNVHQVPGLFAPGTFDADGNYVPALDDDGNYQENTANRLGYIRNIFGGGDKAKVDGYTTVNIATEEKLTVDSSNRSAWTVSFPTDGTPTGVNILNNVYGGGNLADVTGKTYVNIGKKTSETN